MKRRPPKLHPDVREVYLYNGSRLPREPPKEVLLVAYPEHAPLDKSVMSAHAATGVDQGCKGGGVEGELVSINAMQSEDRLPVFVGERLAMEHMDLHTGGLEPNKVWLLLRQNQSAENGVYVVDKDGFLKRPDYELRSGFVASIPRNHPPHFV